MIQMSIDWSEQARMPLEPTSKQGKFLLRSFKAGSVHTVVSALEHLGIYALSQRVGELKRLGWPINDRFVTLSNGKKIKEYWLCTK